MAIFDKLHLGVSKRPDSKGRLPTKNGQDSLPKLLEIARLTGCYERNIRGVNRCWMRLSGDREVSKRYARIRISIKTRMDPCVDLRIHIWDKERPNLEKARPFRSVTRCPQGVWAPGSFNQTSTAGIRVWKSRLQQEITERKQFNLYVQALEKNTILHIG